LLTARGLLRSISDGARTGVLSRPFGRTQIRDQCTGFCRGEHSVTTPWSVGSGPTLERRRAPISQWTRLMGLTRVCANTTLICRCLHGVQPLVIFRCVDVAWLSMAPRGNQIMAGLGTYKQRNESGFEFRFGVWPNKLFAKSALARPLGQRTLQTLNIDLRGTPS